MIIDTHCHLIDEAFHQDIEAVIDSALKADVRQMVLACCDETEFPQIVALSQSYPDILFSTIGIHPENIAADIHQQFDTLFGALAPLDGNAPSDAQPGIVAVGEIGLDLHWDKSRLDDQKEILRMQTEWALDHDLPVLLHIRDAMPQFLDLCRTTLCPMASERSKQLRGILHCYSGNAEQAKEALSLGDFYFGIGGTLTYKKSLVPEVAQAIGIERIVLETDAPYLAPVPHRGRRNEPAYTADTCRALAEILHISAEEVAQKTTKNARNLLKI
ncbi:MAG: TatD family hydrolase [Bacteroidales bacterium]|nr:TatD family hydrolase [Bacteroidales bacterium]